MLLRTYVEVRTDNLHSRGNREVNQVRDKPSGFIPFLILIDFRYLFGRHLYVTYVTLDFITFRIRSARPKCFFII